MRAPIVLLLLGIAAAACSDAGGPGGDPAYRLEIAPDPVVVVQGGSNNATVRLARTDFTGAVTLALENVPTDVSGLFSVNPVSGESTVLRLAVGDAVAAGAYTLTLRGTSTLPDETLSFALRVEEDAVGGTGGSTWQVSSAEFASSPDFPVSITDMFLTFDAERRVTRVRYTFDGTAVDYMSPVVAGTAVVRGDSVEVSAGWLLDNDFEFAGIMNGTRTSIEGLMAFDIQESGSRKLGFGSATLTRQ